MTVVLKYYIHYTSYTPYMYIYVNNMCLYYTRNKKEKGGDRENYKVLSIPTATCAHAKALST